MVGNTWLFLDELGPFLVFIPCLTEKISKFQLITSKFSAFKSNGRYNFQLFRSLKVTGRDISQLLDVLKVKDCYIFQLFSTLKVMVVTFSSYSVC